jgi:chromosome segregation ATPase
MASLQELTDQVAKLSSRLAVAESKIATQAGTFEFITGQLRGVQLYMHARFDDMDKRFNRVDGDIATLKSDVGTLKSDVATLKSDMSEVKTKLDALPRVIAELIAKR